MVLHRRPKPTTINYEECFILLLANNMSDLEKEQMMLEEGHQRNDAVAANDLLASFDVLSVDVLANIYGFLSLEDIMCKRRINKKSMDAVRNAVVPPTYFYVDTVKKYNAMVVMTRAMPNLQKVFLKFVGRTGGDPDRKFPGKWSDGEDPDQRRAFECRNYISHDIEIISNFRKLRNLNIYDKFSGALNGRYPALFKFPLLQTLKIQDCNYLKWDLNMLAGLPLLKRLDCQGNAYLSGNINSLRVLKGTLGLVRITGCSNVEGNFMDLADFPHLKVLDLEQTAVTGDIRDVGENDFPSLKALDLNKTAVTGDIRDIGENDFSSLDSLTLPKGVYGGTGYELQRISDAPDLVRAVYLFKKQRPSLEMIGWYGQLSEDSPDWYESVDGSNEFVDYSPPFYIRFVKAGSRIGYRWDQERNPNLICNACEVNWLDPVPDRESISYEEDVVKLNSQVTKLYRRFYQPPTEEEYTRRASRFEGW